MDRSQLPSPDQTGAEKENNQNLKKPKKSFVKKFFTSCIIIIIALVVLLILAAAYVGAATGLVEVPLISSLVYKTPQPSREVMLEDLDSQKIKSRVEKEVSSGQKVVEVYITEGNLTSIVATSRREETRLETTQAALINDGQKLELFGKLINSNIYLTAVYNVGKDFDGNFNITNVSQFRIGSFEVPNFLIYSGFISEDMIKNLSGATLIEDALSDEGSGLEISNIELMEGKIIEYVSLVGYNGNQSGEEKNLQNNDIGTQVN